MQQTWSSTKLAFIALTDTSLLPARDLEFFTFLCQHSASIQKAAELAQQFKTLLGKQHHGTFDEWLESASHQPVFARFSVEEELSHDAKILWSGSKPIGDTAFSYPNEILLPKGKVDIVDDRADYYG